MKAGRHWIGVLLGILLVAVVFAPAPGQSRLLKTLHDATHGPLFGCVALLVLLWMRTRATRTSLVGEYAIAFGVALALGLATEVAQWLTGRDASWLDARNDALGAVAFLLLFFSVDPQVRIRLTALRRVLAAVVGIGLSAVLVAPAIRAGLEYQQRNRRFPTLVDFSRDYDRYFVLQQNALLAPAQVPPQWAAAPGESALQVRLQAGPYPGIHLIEPRPDWSRFSTLALDLTNPGPDDLTLTLRVHDEAHTWASDDRFNRSLTLRAGARETVRVALDDIRRAPRGRSLQLERIAGIVLFSATPSQAEFLLSRVWLE